RVSRRPPGRPRGGRGSFPARGRGRLRGRHAGERGGRDPGEDPGVVVPSLAGLRVVVTRAEHQSEGLAAAFERAGARVELLPLLEVVPPADPRPLARAAGDLASYDWL